MKTLWLSIPIVVVGLLLMVFWGSLQSTTTPKSSPLIGQALPALDMPLLDNAKKRLTTEMLKGHYALVNVFGTWCAMCDVELPVLQEIKKNGAVPLYGIDWRDTPDAAQKWLKKYGNPYTSIGMDPNGEAVIALGVTGAPETFLVSPEGIVVWHYPGPLTTQLWQQDILPKVQP